MSFEAITPLLQDRYIVSVIAGEDLDIGQVVEVTGDWTVKKTTGVSAKVLGITLTKALNGKKVSVVCRGIARAIASGAISAGDRVVSANLGRVSSYAGHTHVENTAATYTQNATTNPAHDPVIGVALTGAADGETVYVALF